MTEPCMSRHFDNIGKPRPPVEWLVTYGCKDGHEQVAVPSCDRCAESLVDGRQRCGRCFAPMVVTALATHQYAECSDASPCAGRMTPKYQAVYGKTHASRCTRQYTDPEVKP